ASLRMVRALLQARDGSLWIGTFQGLFRADAATTSMVEVRAGAVQPLDIYALAQTPDGDIWAGTAETGLYRIAQGGSAIAHYGHDDSGSAFDIPDDEVRSLAVDADGGLWIGGTIHGLAWLDPQNARILRLAHDQTRTDTIGSNRIQALFRERNGLLL